MKSKFGMDDDLKAKLMPPFVGFNITVIFYQIVFNSGLWGASFSYLNFLLGILLGLVVGSITFVVHPFLLSA